MQGIFTISLDFELHWGAFDKRSRDNMLECYRNTLATIPLMLTLFEKCNVHVTWAVVGALYLRNGEEWESMKPLALPSYSNRAYSAYDWVEKNGLPERYKEAHFALDVIKSISNYAGQEVGTHTYGHYYCLEEFTGKDAFNDDLVAVKRVAAKNNTAPVSLVFPRNQFDEKSLETCAANGIKVVRSNPSNWFWKPIRDKSSTITRKFFRTADAYLPVSDQRTSYPIQAIKLQQNKPIQLPASRFLRPWQPGRPLMNKLKLRRVLNELSVAAARNECYHLWWHPENFGANPYENMQDLTLILNEYTKCKTKKGMQSWNMSEYVQHLA